MNSNCPFIGIDSGLLGAIAVIHPEQIQLFDTPVARIENASGKKKTMYDVREMRNILQRIVDGSYKYAPPQAVIERVHAFPGQGSVSGWAQGMGYGLWIGILTSLGIPFTQVEPRVWKKEFSLSKDKNLSIIRAKELFPTADITLKKHEGRSEALLLCEYARRHLS